jgi:hypothetical protein
MLRNVLVVLAALVLGNLLIFVGEALNWVLYPLPPGFDFNDPAAVATMVANMPVGAFVGVELSYVVASVAGGLLVGRFAASRHLGLAAGVGVAFTLSNFLNLASIPHPLGFAILTSVTFLPLQVGGAWWMRRGA